MACDARTNSRCENARVLARLIRKKVGTVTRARPPMSSGRLGFQITRMASRNTERWDGEQGVGQDVGHLLGTTP